MENQEQEQTAIRAQVRRQQNRSKRRAVKAQLQNLIRDLENLGFEDQVEMFHGRTIGRGHR